MNIRKAVIEDLDRIMPMYERARAFMAENHNPKQWGDGYPQRDIIKTDIENGNYYVCIKGEVFSGGSVGEVQAEIKVDQQEILGGFTLIFGADPTYAVIKEGEWLNEKAYATIHRLASAGIHKGVAEACFTWCKKQCDNLRIDTHEDNKIMQHVIKKAGFVKCGIIFVRDKTPRLAYQWENSV